MDFFEHTIARQVLDSQSIESSLCVIQHIVPINLSAKLVYFFYLSKLFFLHIPLKSSTFAADFAPRNKKKAQRNRFFIYVQIISKKACFPLPSV